MVKIVTVTKDFYDALVYLTTAKELYSSIEVVLRLNTKGLEPYPLTTKLTADVQQLLTEVSRGVRITTEETLNQDATAQISAYIEETALQEIINNLDASAFIKGFELYDCLQSILENK